MLTLYPEIVPYVKHSIDVGPPHQLYVEECGKLSALPVAVVHGGPGAGCEPYQRRFFDPEKYRIILFDQRGCGHSSPHADLQNNNTQALVEDMEKIREHLGIEKWVLFGGSWGSTLSLVYAQTYPERVLGLILRGIFLCRPHEIQWFYQEGACRLLPDYWQDFIKQIPQDERGDIVKAYYQRLTSDDEILQMSAAKAWSKWEARAATLLPRKEVVEHFSNPYTALSLARIECHYFMNDAFLEPNQILNNVHRLSGIPGTIVHGRYDVVCPLENAWELHQCWPQSDLQIVPDAGHSATEPGITDRLIIATNSMHQRLS